MKPAPFLLGHLWFFFSTPIHQAYTSWAERYGGIFLTFFGKNACVVLTGTGTGVSKRCLATFPSTYLTHACCRPQPHPPSGRQALCQVPRPSLNHQRPRKHVCVAGASCTQPWGLQLSAHAVTPSSLIPQDESAVGRNTVGSACCARRHVGQPSRSAEPPVPHHRAARLPTHHAWLRCGLRRLCWAAYVASTLVLVPCICIPPCAQPIDYCSASRMRQGTLMPLQSTFTRCWAG